MRVLAFSDLHHSAPRAAALVEASPAADLVIGAGDFCNARKNLSAALALLDGITAPMIAVPGNAESDAELTEAAGEGMTVLHGSGCEVNGVRFFGIGCAVPETPFGGWSCDLSEDQARVLLDKCDAVDVLISHSPPKGVADETGTGLSIGSVAVREAIERLQPSLVLCGHVHDCWGQESVIGNTRIVNLGPTPNWFDLPEK